MIPESIRKALRARRVEERLVAVERLSSIAGAEATALLAAALRDRSHYIAALAARLLGERGDPGAVPAMVETFRWMAEKGKARDSGCRVRNELALAFGKMEDARASEVLFAGLRTVQVEPDGASLADMGAALRGNCAQALGQIRAPGALAELALLLFDTVPLKDDFEKVAPAKAAAEAIGRLGDAAGIVPLSIAVAHGPDLLFPKMIVPENRPTAVSEVVTVCMDALVVLEAPQIVTLLAPYLAAPEEQGRRSGEEDAPSGPEQTARAYLCARAALALSRTRRPGVQPLLERALETAAPEALQAVAVALANLRSSEARQALVQAAGHVRAAVRAAATAGLALFPEPEVEALLRRLARRDPDARVRQAAAQACP